LFVFILFFPKKHHRSFFGKSPCQTLFPLKLRGGKLVFLSSPPSVFIAFLAVPLHEERGAQKHHRSISKAKPKNLKKKPAKM
jgi:hypothetical protein